MPPASPNRLPPQGGLVGPLVFHRAPSQMGQERLAPCLEPASRSEARVRWQSRRKAPANLNPAEPRAGP